MRGPRIHLSVSEEIKKDIIERKDFNASRFFQIKYREEFLNEEGLREKIKHHTEELNRYKDRLMGAKEEKIVTPSYDSNRCPICSMFFNEKISIRKKIHVYKSLYVCKQCKDSQQMIVEKMVQELKSKEALEQEEEDV